MPPKSRWTKAELIQEVNRLQQHLKENHQHLFTDTQSSIDPFKSIIEVLHQPVLILDSTLRLQNANQAFFTAFSGHFDSIRNQVIYALNNQQWNSPVLHELLEEILPRQLTVHDFLFKHEFPGIGSRTLLLNAQQIQHTHNRQSTIVIAMQDVTVQGRMRQSLEQFDRDLLRSNEELRELALLAAHDLQEPLRMIISYLSLIERRSHEKLDAETQKYMGYAIDGATRMKGLIHDLLTYTSLSVGSDAERGLPFKACDVGNIVARATALLQASIDENNAVITTGRLPTVMAADMQLVQVFMNLIGNAIKFHSTADPHIHIDATYEENEWVFSVQDNGIGIDEKHFNQIFELFRRLHSKGKYEGNGIGLAICKRVIDYHGGRVWVKSEPGKGTTIYFTVPINPLKATN
jgi:signal transduction histidine kinase